MPSAFLVVEPRGAVVDVLRTAASVVAVTALVGDSDVMSGVREVVGISGSTGLDVVPAAGSIAVVS